MLYIWGTYTHGMHTVLFAYSEHIHYALYVCVCVCVWVCACVRAYVRVCVCVYNKYMYYTLNTPFKTLSNIKY